MESSQEKRECSFTDSWIFSVGAALISIPVGIRRKSLAPLVFFGSTGCMLDIIVSVSNCEREFQRKQQQIATLDQEPQQHSFDDYSSDPHLPVNHQSGLNQEKLE